MGILSGFRRVVCRGRSDAWLRSQNCIRIPVQSLGKRSWLGWFWLHTRLGRGFLTWRGLDSVRSDEQIGWLHKSYSRCRREEDRTGRAGMRKLLWTTGRCLVNGSQRSRRRRRLRPFLNGNVRIVATRFRQRCQSQRESTKAPRKVPLLVVSLKNETRVSPKSLHQY